MKSIAFFNNLEGVGKTTLVYNLAWMLAELGETVLAVDLDPQANLTHMFLEEDALEGLWPKGEHPDTIFGALRPLIRGLGDVEPAHVVAIAPRLGLIPGDLALSTLEDLLSDAWTGCQSGDEPSFRRTTAFHRSVLAAGKSFEAAWLLIDAGPNLGAINRAALIASEHIVIPVGPDLFSLQGLRSLGPSLREWCATWHELKGKSPDPGLLVPCETIEPLGYVVLQHGLRENRSPRDYQRWIDRFPAEYRESVLGEPSEGGADPQSDQHRLALLKYHRSLMAMAREARKPVFSLRPADGAIGAHGVAVRNARVEFEVLARSIAAKSGAPLPG